MNAHITDSRTLSSRKARRARGSGKLVGCACEAKLEALGKQERSSERETVTSVDSEDDDEEEDEEDEEFEIKLCVDPFSIALGAAGIAVAKAVEPCAELNSVAEVSIVLTRAVAEPFWHAHRSMIKDWSASLMLSTTSKKL